MVRNVHGSDVAVTCAFFSGALSTARQHMAGKGVVYGDFHRAITNCGTCAIWAEKLYRRQRNDNVRVKWYCYQYVGYYLLGEQTAHGVVLYVMSAFR